MSSRETSCTQACRRFTTAALHRRSGTGAAHANEAGGVSGSEVRKRAAERTSRDDVSTEQADAHTDQGCGLEGVACTLCGDSEDPAKAGAKESGPGFLIVE